MKVIVSPGERLASHRGWGKVKPPTNQLHIM